MGRSQKPINEVVPAKGRKGYLDPMDSVKPGTKGSLVSHIMQTMDIAKRADPNNLETLYDCLQDYLMLCARSNISVTNTGLYAAIGVTGDTISNWATGKVRSTDPRYREFALLVRRLCGQYRELAASEGKLHPTLTIWWQKNYDGFVDVPIPEKEAPGAFQTAVDPEEIAEKYKHLLTDDSGQRMEKEREKRSVSAMPIDEEEDEE